MDITHVQEYFREQIAAGTYEIMGRFGNKIFLEVENSPFCIYVGTRPEYTTQTGNICDNYINLGTFTEQQKNDIYDREN